jgi:hypothetical protein
MRRIFVSALVVLFLMSGSTYAIDAVGSVFGSLSTAKALGQGRGNLGGGVGIADATSFFGLFSYGLSDYTDFRLKAGMYDWGDNVDAELSFGADFKYQVWDLQAPTGNCPFDMAIGGFLEYLSGDGGSVLELGGAGIGSYGFIMSNNQVITPYGRVNIRLERVSVDLPHGGDDSESNIKFGLNAGVSWQPTNTLSVFGEFQIDGNDGLFLGIDFGVM